MLKNALITDTMFYFCGYLFLRFMVSAKLHVDTAISICLVKCIVDCLLSLFVLLYRLLPTVLAWLFMRKFHIKLKIGRIAVPKLVLKDVTLSKDKYFIVSNKIR